MFKSRNFPKQQPAKTSNNPKIETLSQTLRTTIPHNVYITDHQPPRELLYKIGKWGG